MITTTGTARWAPALGGGDVERDVGGDALEIVGLDTIIPSYPTVPEAIDA
ncbi:hypothetical protein [Streptomyces aureus]